MRMPVSGVMVRYLATGCAFAVEQSAKRPASESDVVRYIPPVRSSQVLLSSVTSADRLSKPWRSFDPT